MLPSKATADIPTVFENLRNLLPLGKWQGRTSLDLFCSWAPPGATQIRVLGTWDTSRAAHRSRLYRRNPCNGTVSNLCALRRTIEQVTGERRCCLCVLPNCFVDERKW